MKTEHIEVVDYDSKWVNDFNQIKGEIEEALKDLVLVVEHVGSTSVPLLAAKPIIDLDVVIDQNDLKEVIYLLENHGYIYEGDLGLKDREAFRYEGKEHLRIHHLYVCPQDSKELKRHLAFRNYLRNHPNTVKEYGKCPLLSRPRCIRRSASRRQAPSPPLQRPAECPRADS